MKKAQGMPLNVIIIAALVLLVLIVLIFIFSGKLKDWNQGTFNCRSKGGECKGAGGLCNEADGEVRIGDPTNTDCPGECCMKVS